MLLKINKILSFIHEAINQTTTNYSDHCIINNNNNNNALQNHHINIIYAESLRGQPTHPLDCICVPMEIALYQSINKIIIIN